MNLKSIFLLAMVSLLSFTACNKDEKNNAPESLFVTYAPRADDVIVSQTNFEVNEPNEVEGDIIVYKNDFHHVLRFENFSINNGPNLSVYLSTTIEDVANSIRVGDLRAASGSFNYTFSVNTDLNVYKHVLIRSDDQEAVYCWAVL